MPRAYKTVQGDMWDYIAKRELGSEDYMVLLLECNQEYRHYALLPAGLELVLPDIPNKVTSIAPPWRR